MGVRGVSNKIPIRVTLFGKILNLGKILKVFGIFFEDLIRIEQNCEPTLANSMRVSVLGMYW